MTQEKTTYCKKHPDIKIRKSIIDYCPECEGYFSAHGFNDIRSCPRKYNEKRKQDKNRDLGRAYPLIKGSVVHEIIKFFNNSLEHINKKLFDVKVSKILQNFNNFKLFCEIYCDKNILLSVERELYSFYLFKKELYESFLSYGKPELIIPLISEKWLSIPFSRKQYNAALNNGPKFWSRIGIHNILDEVFKDVDGKLICIDYKSYPRKTSGKISPIKSVDKKYQLITALMTVEYNYSFKVKYVANVDVGTKEFPNVSYYIPTNKGIYYYKKSLLEAYKNLIDKNFYPKHQKFNCNFCEFKSGCPHVSLKEWNRLNNLFNRGD